MALVIITITITIIVIITIITIITSPRMPARIAPDPGGGAEKREKSVFGNSALTFEDPVNYIASRLTGRSQLVRYLAKSSTVIRPPAFAMSAT